MWWQRKAVRSECWGAAYGIESHPWLHFGDICGSAQLLKEIAIGQMWPTSYFFLVCQLLWALMLAPFSVHSTEISGQLVLS